MARYDDGKRGFAVTDAISLSDAWIEFYMLTLAGEIQFCDRAPPPEMLAIFGQIYPPDQLQSSLRAQMQKEDAQRAMISAIREDKLQLWVAPVDGQVAERPVSGQSLIEFERQSLEAGCYRPFNDRQNAVYGYPLFVKRACWKEFLARLQLPADRRAIERAPQSGRPRKLEAVIEGLQQIYPDPDALKHAAPKVAVRALVNLGIVASETTVKRAKRQLL